MGLMTPYIALDALIVIAMMIVSAYFYMTRKFKYWERQGVVEVPPTPFFGNFADCLLQRKSTSEFLKCLYNSAKGQPYMGFYIFDRPFFLVRDPELVKSILVKDFNVFSDRYTSVDVTDRLGYANLFLIKNPAWKTLRAKLSPIYTSGKLKKMFELMLEVADDLDDHLASLHLSGTGKEIEIKDMCASFTTDLIATTAYGIKTNSMKNPNCEFRNHGRKMFTPDVWRSVELTSIFFAPGLVPIMGFKFFGKDSSKFLRSALQETINHRMESGVKRNDLIDLLIELKEKHKGEDLGGFQFDGDDLVAQAAVFFTAGFETSSSVISFTLYELAVNPDIQKTLRNEIQDALEESGGKITYDMLMSLSYLDMVVSETLRKYPTLGFLDRVANTDYKVPNSNIVLRKGTPVYIPVLAFHHDPEYFPEPEKYDPERFTDENKRKRPGSVYFPFGEGPHICIGMRLGLLQSKLGIVQVLRKYEVAPSERTAIPMKLDRKALTTTAFGGVYLNVRSIDTVAG